MEKYQYSESQRAFMENAEMPFAIYQFMEKRVVTLILSKGFCKLFGYDDPAEAYYDMDHNMYKDTHPDDAARIADAAFRFATEGGVYEVVYRTRMKNDSGFRIIHAHGQHVYTDTGVRLAQVWYTDEGSFTEDDGSVNFGLTQALKNALYDTSVIKASFYDHLTGLPSMTYFFELATGQRDAVQEAGDTPALLFMDFSGMKYFNHKYGFAEGDRLLQAFSRVLADHFGNENCSRLGQDHFAAITKAESLEQVLEQLFEECSTLNDGRSLHLHVGIYLQWYDGIVASMACDRAKFACDTLRNKYASCFSYYNASMKDAEEKQQYIIANLDKAIEERWIKVYYQPIVRAVNGKVCDEEALARWIDPVRGFMSPADFIPILEDHRLIYKLDLFILDCVLIKIRTLAEAGLHLMPQSINLSRSDFDTCDIVEEIRRRVDDAGISRHLVTIEITESIIGKDFDFIKTQIDRFRELGFAVWMDDFGSGYSSLDVLQSVRFDLIKFDMRFMQQLSNGNQGKIILTELLKMATMLGIDTICEGVETLEQVQFLQEAGCSKLQGYYFDKPIPVEKILEKYAKGTQIGFENPDESTYFESIGRMNLHDLSIIAQENLNEFSSFFNSLPMGIIEIRDDKVRFTRTNKSYREFINRYFQFSIDDTKEPFYEKPGIDRSAFMKALMQSCRDEKTLFVDEVLPSGTTLHSCIRRIAVNPSNGTVATAVAVLSVKDNHMGTTYANIARALAADYFNLYYVNIETEKFIEYSSKTGDEELAIERHGEDFFRTSRQDALEYVYCEDRDDLIAAFNKENILRELDAQGTFSLTYRLMMDGEPVYVNMKVMRMQEDPVHLIIGVSNVDSQMKQKQLIENIHRTEVIYARIMALSGDYVCLYTVDPETEDYIQYSAANIYQGVGLAQEGKHFFAQSLEDCEKLIHPDDQETFMIWFSKENVMASIRMKGLFTLKYRLVISGEVIPVSLRVTLVKEDGVEKLIIGVFRQDGKVSD